MIYYLFWVDSLSISVLASVAVFLWMLKAGHLSQQDRARFQPLRGEHFAPMSAPPAKSRPQWCAMIAILALGFLILLGPFLLLLR